MTEHLSLNVSSADWLDDAPRAQCSECGRKTWEAGMVGHICYMPQPDGSTCAGVFVALPENDR